MRIHSGACCSISRALQFQYQLQLLDVQWFNVVLISICVGAAN